MVKAREFKLWKICTRWSVFNYTFPSFLPLEALHPSLYNNVQVNTKGATHRVCISHYTYMLSTDGVIDADDHVISFRFDLNWSIWQKLGQIPKDSPGTKINQWRKRYARAIWQGVSGEEASTIGVEASICMGYKNLGVWKRRRDSRAVAVIASLLE